METMYHITTKQNLQKINKDKKLIPQRPFWDFVFFWKNFKQYPKAIYLSRSPYWLRCFFESPNPRKFNDVVFLEIKTDNLKLYRDYEFPSSFYCDEEIPFDNIINVFYITDSHLEMDLKLVHKSKLKKVE